VNHPSAPGAFTVMSYNLWKNHAVSELSRLESDHSIDVLCLQETYTATLPETLGELRLAASTGNDRLGLAIYARDYRFRVEETKSYTLARSVHDVVLAPTPERLVGARLVDETTGDRLVVASFHAAPLTALNSVRRRQIDAAHGLLRSLAGDAPIVMIGDFNYPFFTERLRGRLASTDFHLTRGTSKTYRKFPMYRGTFDLVTAAGFDVSPITTLHQGLSDHFPILATATPTGSDSARADRRVSAAGRVGRSSR
jgi:exodeoxyribonuclease-3